MATTCGLSFLMLMLLLSPVDPVDFFKRPLFQLAWERAEHAAAGERLITVLSHDRCLYKA